MLEVRNLVRRFGPIRAVNGVSFTVRPGEVLGFLGPNGAGKTTTLRMLTGFLPVTSGTVRVCGHEVRREPVAACRCIGYLPEGAPLYGDMTPRSLLDFLGRMRGLARPERRAALARAAGLARIEDVLEQPVETLSKGYKRRVGLAQAILHDPPVLLLDEPTDGLDPNQKHEVRRLVRNLAREKVVVLSTHILEEVEAVCSRAVILAHGRILFDGTPAELLARSARHGAIRVGLRGVETAPALALLRSLEGVRQVRVLSEAGAAAGRLLRLLVLPRPGSAPLLPVLRVLEKQAWGVEELAVERGRLDQVFRRLTAGREEADS